MSVETNQLNSCSTSEARENIGFQLCDTAAKMPDGIAIAAPIGQGNYRQITFRELDEDSDRIAAGLQAMGLKKGQRIVLMVRPGIDFISLTFALFKSGAVVVLIDPGMGRAHLVDCLEAVRPEGFVAIPLAHVARLIYRKRFPSAKLNVTVGRRWFWGGPTIRQLRTTAHRELDPNAITADDPAAIIFTTGSTGPPKGVLYQHGNFSAQVQQLRDTYSIQPGEIDLPGFPLFALFNCAMGVTTIIPEMDPTKPAEVNPANIVQPILQWNVTQAFGSPALWNVVGQYCEANQVKLPTLRRVLSAGAPVPNHVLKRMMNAIADDGDVHTPYGATESLPVATIAASEVLNQTAQQTAQGAGTCVGRKFSGIRWKVIRIHDDPIEFIDQIEELPHGEIGELIVQGPVITQRYVTREEANALAKIKDPAGTWHRMGDVGYLDNDDRFWFCGRKAHRIVTAEATMFTIRCEAIFNQHSTVYRSAVVGMGKPPQQTPALIVEPWPEYFPKDEAATERLLDELFELGQSSDLTNSIKREHMLVRESLPVDIRHNAKIFREKLAVWAQEQLA